MQLPCICSKDPVAFVAAVLAAELWGGCLLLEELNDLVLPSSGSIIAVPVSREHGDGCKTLAGTVSSRQRGSILGFCMHVNNLHLKKEGWILLAQKHCAKGLV